MLPSNLLQSLHKAENDIHTFYPIARRHAELQTRLAILEQGYEEYSNDESLRQFNLQTIGYIIGAVITLILSITVSKFILFGFAGAVFWCLLRVPVLLKTKKTKRETEEAIMETESDIAKSTQLISIKIREMAGMQIWKTMMPKECLIPEYARQFINYIETNQVSSLQDANMMFDRFLHREQMSEEWAENAAIISAVSRVVNSADTAARAPRRPAQNAVAPSAGCFCPSCGTKNEASARFCASCGGRLN